MGEISKTKKPPYLTNKDLKLAYDESIATGAPTRKLILMFEKIAKRYSSLLSFVNKCDLDACVNYAITEAWRKWDKYDEEKSNNIFSFYTEMIKNDLMQHSKKINKLKSMSISIDALYSDKD